MSSGPLHSSSMVPKTLTEARRERKGYEQDAVLLQNRLNFLQGEESKTWIQIKKTQRMQSLVEEARKLKHEQRKKQSQALCIFEKQRLENQQKIQQLKENIQRNKLLSRQNLQNCKKQAYFEVRNLKEENFERKMKNEADVLKDNKKRSSSVKVDRIKVSIRKYNQQEQKQIHFKEEYLKKIYDEVQRQQTLQQKISELEQMEGDLIKKLQNTQSLHHQVVQEYEKMNPKISKTNHYLNF